MARRAALILGLLVLALHVALLEALSARLGSPGLLQPMAPALFTREIVAQTAPPPEKPKEKAASRQSAGRSDASKSVADAPVASVSAPEPVASAPVPAAAPLPAEPVSAPAPTASSPAAGLGPVAVLGPTPAGADSAVGTPEPARAAAAPATAAGDAWPADTRLSYALKGHYRGPVGGSARVQWQRNAERYEVGIVIDLGLMLNLRMTSQGEVGHEHLAPRAYEERIGTRVRPLRLEATQVELANGTRLPRPPQVQDTASQFVELAQRFRTDPSQLATGKTVQVWLARPGGMDEWTYDVLGSETLHSERLGAIEAFHLKPRPIPNPRGPIHAEIWFAPTLQYLPVRIRLVIGPDAWLDLMVERIEQGSG